MSFRRYAWVTALLIGGATGCQCSVLTHYYSDAIDDISDHELEMDALYRPQWDLNRIGKPDWCQSAWNRFWCRCHGCDECTQSSVEQAVYHEDEFEKTEQPHDDSEDVIEAQEIPYEQDPTLIPPEVNDPSPPAP
ncbi:MAG: hypothetical protein ACKVT0_15195 [Planctomycetaceae bacterium]